jgi:prepilin-type N-terminal cleavage/methylation domain-containing protein
MKGFSLLEITIVTAIALILASLSLSTFFTVSDNQALTKNVEYTISLIQQARTQTLNALNNSRYSVLFASSSVTLFQGTTYSSTSASNIKFDLSSKVQMSSINLTGGVQQVSFDFITGKANATGTISFQLKNNTNASSTIILYKTGLAEIL